MSLTLAALLAIAFSLALSPLCVSRLPRDLGARATTVPGAQAQVALMRTRARLPLVAELAAPSLESGTQLLARAVAHEPTIMHVMCTSRLTQLNFLDLT